MIIIKSSNSFSDVIKVVKQLKCKDESVDNENILKCDAKVNEMQQDAAKCIEDEAKHSLERECCSMLLDIGPPWNWLHNFTSHNCFNKSYNFIEQVSISSNMTLEDGDDDIGSTDEMESLNMSDSAATLSKQLPPSDTLTKSVFDDVQSSTSDISTAQLESHSANSVLNEHKILVDTICNLSEAMENGECMIREASSIALVLEAQHKQKHLETIDYERLKKFIDRAMENGLVFNDLNELYNYFIQESSREHYMKQRQMELKDAHDGNAEVGNLILPSTSLSAGKRHKKKETEAVKNNENDTVDGKNVVSIFGESGIEVDNKLLDSKVSESMILGLVDKTQSDIDNISDAASSNASLSSILSNAETVKMKDTLNVTREKNTQTISYQQRIYENRIRSGQSKSASFIEQRQPFTCKIPKLPGIGTRLNDEIINKILNFITHRSFQQGGYVYPKNFLEYDCPSLIEN